MAIQTVSLTEKRVLPNEKKARTQSDKVKVDRIECTIKQLQDLHKDKFSNLQYRLWAEMIDVDSHKSLDYPPNVPAFGGMQQNPKRLTLASAVTELGTAIATAVSGRSVPLMESPKSSTGGDRKSITPTRKADIRSKYITQLRELHQLLDVGAIEEKEYVEQKSIVMDELKSI